MGRAVRLVLRTTFRFDLTAGAYSGSPRGLTSGTVTGKSKAKRSNRLRGRAVASMTKIASILLAAMTSSAVSQGRKPASPAAVPSAASMSGSLPRHSTEVGISGLSPRLVRWCCTYLLEASQNENRDRPFDPSTGPAKALMALHIGRRCREVALRRRCFESARARGSRSGYSICDYPASRA